MEFTNDQLKTALKNAQPMIDKRVQEAITNQLIESLAYSASDRIKSECIAFIEAEIVPDVKKTLMANKDKIKENMQSVAIETSTALLAKIQENIKKNLEGYRGTEILKSLIS